MGDSKEFKAIIVNPRYITEEFKIYVVDIDKTKYNNIKTNKNNECIIVGNTHNLVPNIEYTIKAKEENGKYGYQYKVVNIRREKPTNKTTTRKFLQEILTQKQADALLNVYPNIVDKVINNDLNDIDLSKVKGIADATFNKIKNKIIENFCLMDLVDSFGGNISFSVIKKLYDTYTSVEKVMQKMKLNPYDCLCSLSRVAFKTADSILLNIEKQSKDNLESDNNEVFHFVYDLKTSEQRIKSCIIYLLEENENSGNTRMCIKELRKKCDDLTPQCMSHFLKIIKDDNSFYIDNKTKTIAIKQTYNTEKYIAQKIIKMLNCSNENRWNINTELYRENKDGNLTDEQMNTLKNLCKYNVSILTAPAGSGKSFSIKKVVDMLDDNNKTYSLMTPTGKSSEILTSYVGKDAGTIHRKLDYNPKNDPPWGLNEKNPLLVDVVICDEFSMVDIFLMKHLLDAIKIGKTKLLLVLDSYQLSSVACGNIAHDLLTSGIIPTTYLTKIFRYNEGGLMQIATKIRKGESFLSNTFTGVKIFGSKKDYIYVESLQSKIMDQILKIYKKLLSDNVKLENIMVLSCYNKGDYGSKAINKQIQDLIQKGKNNKYIQRGDTRFYKGDKIIQIKNNYKALNVVGEEIPVYNGNTGVVKEIRWEEIIVGFKNQDIVYKKDDLDQIELGYCVSNHKSQGDAAENIIMITPKAHTFMLNSNLLYVGATRGKKRVYHIGNIKTVNQALKKKENFERNTFLQDLIKELLNEDVAI